MLWGILAAYATGLGLAWGELQELFQSEEFVIASATLALILASTLAGWTLRTVSAGHREAKLTRLFGDGTYMTKVARRRRQEDHLYEAISGLVYKKVMSGREAKRLFRVLAEKAGLEGLCIPAKEYTKLHAYQMARLKAKTEASLAKLQAQEALPLPKEEPKPTKPSVVRNLTSRVKTRWAA